MTRALEAPESCPKKGCNGIVVFDSYFGVNKCTRVGCDHSEKVDFSKEWSIDDLQDALPALLGSEEGRQGLKKVILELVSTDEGFRSSFRAMLNAGPTSSPYDASSQPTSRRT